MRNTVSSPVPIHRPGHVVLVVIEPAATQHSNPSSDAHPFHTRSVGDMTCALLHRLEATREPQQQAQRCR